MGVGFGDLFGGATNSTQTMFTSPLYRLRNANFIRQWRIRLQLRFEADALPELRTVIHPAAGNDKLRVADVADAVERIAFDND